jgi:hypothetical protein
VIAIVIPVLGRPQQIQRVIASIDASTTVEYRVLFVCSQSDRAGLDACRSVDTRQFIYIRIVEWEPGKGDFARKTNTGFAEVDEPFVFLGATDLRFLPGWDHAALRVAEESGAGVIGTDDMGNALVRRGRHATHPLVRRAYIEEFGGTFDDEPGIVYAECYDHQCVDNELVCVAQERSQWAFARDSKVEHLHPLWRKSPMDATYEKALARGQQDIRLFGKRRADWTSRRRRTRVGA